MNPAKLHPLLRGARAPTAVARFSADDWNRCLRAARAERVLARLGYRIEDTGALDHCPAAARDQLLAARAYPGFLQCRIAHEVAQVRRALSANDGDLILLKGAAYHCAGFPLTRGRQLRDLDILVPRARIDACERDLLAGGWEAQTLDEYDQRYYRDWMHEIPPLRHPQRDVEVDLHHRLLPLTSRLQPDPDLLWETSVPVAEMPGVRVLSPVDMLLHTATHLFHDGPVRGGLNDLWDIDELLRHFAARPAFWETLPERAARLDLGRPLYYGLLFSHALLDTPIPDVVLTEVGRRFAPNRPIGTLMHALVSRALPPQEGRSALTGLTNWLLYLRSHWLRMPPHLLLPHLIRKSLRRLDGLDHHSGRVDKR